MDGQTGSDRGYYEPLYEGNRQLKQLVTERRPTEIDRLRTLNADLLKACREAYPLLHVLSGCCPVALDDEVRRVMTLTMEVIVKAIKETAP
jgi:hypothetical protein